MFRIILVSLFLTLASTVIARAEEEIDVDRIFDDWSVFMDKQDCWIATFVDFGPENMETDLYYFVTFHHQTPEPRLSLVPGAGAAFAATPTIFTNKNEIEVQLRDGNAFPARDDEGNLFRAMLEEQLISVILPIRAGASLTGVVSLRGFKAAYNFISKECEFKFNPELSDRSGIEPT